MTFGKGLTVTVSFETGPTQPFAVGVITNTTIPGVVLGSVNVCAGIVLVVPLAIKPVIPFGLEPVHVCVAPATFEVRLILLVEVPLQIVWNAGKITCGVGLTVMLYVAD